MVTLLPFLVLAPGNQAVRGTGKPLTQVRKISAVKAVQAGTAITVEIRTGAPKLTIEAQKEILPMVKTRIAGGRLIIMTEGTMNTDFPIKAHLWLPSVESISGIGATSFDIAALSGRRVEIELTGASKIKAKGHADNLVVTLNGASNANLREVPATNVTVEANGASQATVRPASKLQATATGASTINYVGRPAMLQKSASGASTISGIR